VFCIDAAEELKDSGEVDVFELSEFLNEECASRCGLTPSSLAQLLNFVINAGLARIDALSTNLVLHLFFLLFS
jgi:hypothetical protein